MTRYLYILLLLCGSLSMQAQNNEPFIRLLGIVQDGGYPHMGCTKKCCNMAWADASLKRSVVSFAVVDPVSKKWWLFEATPDIKEQLHYFQQLTNSAYRYLPDGIFITHAHIGHYTGLMELGREVMNTKNVPVYVLPKMKTFLEINGPWSQLVKLNNIELHALEADVPVALTGNISVTAFTVPHRDEYSETAGFSINTGTKKYLFIPDINKWNKWNRNIVTEVKAADIALLDATFCDSTELPGRNMSEVPHPFVIETMKLFEAEDAKTKAKIHFIHFNHTNPILWDADKRKDVLRNGFNIALQGELL